MIQILWWLAGTGGREGSGEEGRDPQWTQGRWRESHSGPALPGVGPDPEGTQQA